MFINLFCGNVCSIVGLNTEFIQKCYVEVTDFNNEIIWFNSVFIDNNGVIYRGNGSSIPVEYEFINFLENKDRAEYRLTEILIDCLNKGVDLNDISVDDVIFSCLLNIVHN